MKRLIYLVDDSLEISEMIGIFLASADLEIVSFATVKDFKAALAKVLPGLIILDVMLPDGNGFEVCKEVKSNGATSHLPIIMMSAQANTKFATIEAGADDFISKPFDIFDFTTRVRKHIGLIAG